MRGCFVSLFIFVRFERSDTFLKKRKVSLGVESSSEVGAVRRAQRYRRAVRVFLLLCRQPSPPALLMHGCVTAVRGVTFFEGEARAGAAAPRIRLCMAKRFSLPPPLQLNCLIHGIG